MVGINQPQPPSTAVMKPTKTEQDQFLKTNTDCVYFLASPLTCKKGSECEYRHSDIARVNPRDCYYWLNGNCLNPKCAFRHPPLDGLLGAEDPTPVPQAPVKQGVACIFFQKGFCLKGHFCPFLHGSPNVFNNKAVQPVPHNPVTNPSKIASAGSEKPIQEQKFIKQESVQKPVEFTQQVLRNGNGASGAVAMEKKVVPPSEKPPRYRPASVVLPTVINESPVNRFNNGVYETNHVNGVYETNHVSDNEGINGKDVDEHSREPTPGFDVLVDNELGDSEHYPNEERFDMGRSIDYDVERDMYNEQRDFDRYNMEGYAWEDNKEFSYSERKRYPRNGSPDQFDFDKSDLRHQISKQRRGNNVGGLRSVVSRENPRDGYNDWIPRRDSHHDRHGDPGHISSLLRGRIKIPGRSMSPGNANGFGVEREIDMGRQYRSRNSPGSQPHRSSNHNRFRDRINGRATGDFNNERRDYQNSRNRNQSTDDGQTLGKRKYPRVENQQSAVNGSFEGPKPLSEILKRKRGSVICIVNNEEDNNSNENNHSERKEAPFGNMANSNKAGTIDDNALLDQEVEAYDPNNGDYNYEQLDGEYYNLEEGEEEYMVEEEEVVEIGKKESEVYS